MKKIKLTEKELNKVVKKVLNESMFMPSKEWYDKYNKLNHSSDISLADYINTIISDLYNKEWISDMVEDGTTEEEVYEYIEETKRYLLNQLDVMIVEFLGDH